MGTRSDQPLRGLILHDERITTTNLDATNSSYSQSTGRPGVSVPDDSKSRLSPIVSSEQVNKVTTQVMGAGMPEVSASGCSMVYYTGAETNASARGAISANVITGLTTPKYTASQSWLSFDINCIPSTQEAIIVVDGQTHQLGTIGTDGAWDMVTLPGDGPVSLCVIPETERVLMFSEGSTTHSPQIDYTDDKGATISEYATGVLATDPTGTVDTVRMRYHKGDISLVTYSGGSTTITQYYSDSLGTRFSKVEDQTATKTPSLLSLADGSLGMVYLDTADDLPKMKKVGAASQSFNDATAIEIDSGFTIQDIAAAVDADGVVYCYGVSDAGNTGGASQYQQGNMAAWFSVDNGDTWTKFTRGPFDSTLVGGNMANPTNLCTFACGGSILMLANWNNAGTAALSTFESCIGCYRLGGWSNVTNGYISTTHNLKNRQGFGREANTAVPNNNIQWFPFVLPDEANWTKTSSTVLAALGSGVFTINTPVLTGAHYYTRVLDGAEENMTSLFELAVVSGGDVTTNKIATRIKRSGATLYWDASIRFSTTQVRVEDELGSTLATVTIDTTKPREYLCFIKSSIADDEAWIWVYQRLSQASNQQSESTWTAIAEGIALTSGGGVELPVITWSSGAISHPPMGCLDGDRCRRVEKARCLWVACQAGRWLRH